SHTPRQRDDHRLGIRSSTRARGPGSDRPSRSRRGPLVRRADAQRPQHRGDRHAHVLRRTQGAPSLGLKYRTDVGALDAVTTSPAGRAAQSRRGEALAESWGVPRLRGAVGVPVDWSNRVTRGASWGTGPIVVWASYAPPRPVASAAIQVSPCAGVHRGTRSGGRL